MVVVVVNEDQDECSSKGQVAPRKSILITVIFWKMHPADGIISTSQRVSLQRVGNRMFSFFR